MRCRALAIVGCLAAASCHYVLPSPREVHGRDGGRDAAPQDRAAEGRADLVADLPAAEDLPASMAWWNAAWKRRRRLTISNPGAQPVAAGLPVVAAMDFHAVVSAPSTAHVRVVRAEPPSWVELSRHVDDDAYAAEELVWFRLREPLAAGGNDTSYWLYYDSPTAGWPGNGTDVFEWLDAFSPGEVDAARWDVSPSGTVTQSWALQLGPGARVRSVGTVNPGRALDVFVHADRDAWRVGLQRSPDFADGEPYFRWAHEAGAGRVVPQALATPTGQTAPWAAAGVTASTRRHLFTIERYATRVVFAVDLQQHADHPLAAAYASGMQLRFDNVGSATVYLRDVHVRQVVSPAPQIRLGPAEQRP